MRHLDIVAIMTIALSATPVFADPIAASVPPLLRYDFSDSEDPTQNLGSLGSGFNGDLIANAHFGPPVSDEYVVLDGVGDYILPVGTESAFDIGDADFSLFARVRTAHVDSSCGTAERGVIWKERTGAGAGIPGYTFGVLKDAGVVRLTLFAVNPGVSVTGTTPVNDGEFHNILGVRRGGQIELYVDGILDATAPIGAIGSTNNNNLLVIGGRTLSGTGCTFDDDFIGDISEIRVYNVAVSPAAQPVPTLSRGGWIALAMFLLATMVASFRKRSAGPSLSHPGSKSNR